MSAAIEMRGVTKTFGDTVAVDKLDLTIPTGALYGFIGPNGAGKTTSIRMLMSILHPDSGRLEVLGHESALEAKDRIGYLPEERGVYRKMRVGAYLTFIGRLKSVPDDILKQRVPDLLERVELAHVRAQRCDEMSKGMLQKIQFLAAIVNEPDLLILDEPFSGLDPVSMRLLREQIVAEHERGATILFSTHVMPQAEEICDHVIMIHRGQKVLDDPVQAIRNRHDTGMIVFEPLQVDAPLDAVSALPEAARMHRRDGQYELSLRAGSDSAAVIAKVAGLVPLARIEMSRPRLEDIFVELVTGESSEAAEQLRTELVAPALETSAPA